MRRALAIALAGAVVLATGCGEKQERPGVPRTQRIDLVLDYFPNADHVGIYAALRRGYFRRVGLDVRPRTPPDPSAPLKLLAAGRADLAISYEPELLLARDRGARLVSVAAIVQRPLTSIVSLGSAGIRTPADLQGKRVGTAGIPYQSAYLSTILEQAGVDARSVKETNVGFNLVPAMLSGKVDATLGAFWNYEAIQLAQRHKHPNVIRMERAGVPTYDELIVVARQSDLRNRGAVVRRFVRALGQGYLATRRDPRAAVDALVRANPDLKRSLQLASVRATLPVFFPAGRRPFGYQDPAQWAAYGEWMLRNRLVRQPPSADQALTNEFLPGQGF